VRLDESGGVTYDSSPEWAQQALEGSLRRLRTETVDLFQMHYWDGVTPLHALFDRLERLRGQGKIRWYGVTNLDPRQALPDGYPGLVSASLEYSLLERSHERAAREVFAAGRTFLSYGSLGQGMLSGKYRSGEAFGADDRRSRPQYRNFHGERLQRNLRIVERLETLALRQGVTASQLAIAWILRQLPGSAVLVGIKRVGQLLDLLGALDLKVPESVRLALDEVSRI
jgi:aryl-alcohol dehydrogenase-like predicted oxidoreductase